MRTVLTIAAVLLGSFSPARSRTASSTGHNDLHAAHSVTRKVEGEQRELQKRVNTNGLVEGFAMQEDIDRTDENEAKDTKGPR